jgi:hypothetical protein
MYVPRKPHPMGNEYHTIACGVCGILFALSLVEGKDSPPEARPKKYTALGKTAATLLTLCESLFSTGKVVVLDSGFCVLQAIVELKKKGVFAAAAIKKRRYWPRHIGGEAIKARHDNKPIGQQERLSGSFRCSSF